MERRAGCGGDAWLAYHPRRCGAAKGVKEAARRAVAVTRGGSVGGERARRRAVRRSDAAAGRDRAE